MNEETTQALEAINQRFYQEHAQAFANARQAPWPGFFRTLPNEPQSARLRVLDVGAGHGRYADFLCRVGRRPLDYLGIDSSEPLLDLARARGLTDCRFELGDAQTRALEPQAYDLVTALGVIHHIPSRQKRRALIEKLAAAVAPGGRLVLTFWRFTRHDHKTQRIQPWSRAPQIDPTQLEQGDHLLSFGTGDALRYCHEASPDEIEALANASGLVHVETFDADGVTGDLNRYLLLARADRAPGSDRSDRSA